MFQYCYGAIFLVPQGIFMELRQEQPRILLVDDDKSDRLLARRALEKQNYCIFEAMNGQRLQEILKDYSVDLILLDLMLPGESGLNLIGTIRNTTNAPIIIVSGIQNLKEKKEGLDKGADDYLTKPFFPEELQARIKANLRRYHDSRLINETPVRLSFYGWLVDATLVDVISPSGQQAGLTVHEYRLLEKLIMANGRVLTRLDLTDHPSKRGIDVQVTRLRKKLQDAGSAIKTVRGLGYRFDAPVEII